MAAEGRVLYRLFVYRIGVPEIKIEIFTKIVPEIEFKIDTKIVPKIVKKFMNRRFSAIVLYPSI